MNTSRARRLGRAWCESCSVEAYATMNMHCLRLQRGSTCVAQRRSMARRWGCNRASFFARIIRSDVRANCRLNTRMGRSAGRFWQALVICQAHCRCKCGPCHHAVNTIPDPHRLKIRVTAGSHTADRLHRLRNIPPSLADCTLQQWQNAASGALCAVTATALAPTE